VTTSGDTQALPRIPVPGMAAGSAHPTVALTLAVAPEPAAQPEPAHQPEPAPAGAPAAAEAPVVAPGPAAEPAVEPAAEAPAESHERIYEEAMATIAALASGWCSSVQRTAGRHRAAA
jgi:ribonuclease E